MTMQKSFARLGIILAVAFGLLFVASTVLGSGIVHAQDTDAACRGVSLAGGDCSAAGAEGSLGNIIATVVDILSIIVGALSVIMIIIGGLRYITSAGDSSKTAGAKNTILYAVVGLIIVIFAQVIVNFVIDTSTNGVNTTTETTEETEEDTPAT